MLRTRLPLILSIWLLLTFKIVNQAEGELFSSIVGASISAGASLIGTTTSALSSNGPNRNIVIEITNHLDTDLIGGQYFLQWGWNRTPPPSVIKSKTNEAIQFEKVGDTATGTAGILKYTVSDHKDPATFIIDFSIPFNYIHASNWFGLVFADRNTKMDKTLYDKLYDDPAWKNPKIYAKFGYAYEGKPVVIYHNDYIVSATMSNFGRSILRVDVHKRAGGHGKNHYLFQ